MFALAIWIVCVAAVAFFRIDQRDYRFGWDLVALAVALVLAIASLVV